MEVGPLGQNPKLDGQINKNWPDKYLWPDGPNRKAQNDHKTDKLISVLSGCHQRRRSCWQCQTGEIQKGHKGTVPILIPGQFQSLTAWRVQNPMGHLSLSLTKNLNFPCHIRLLTELSVSFSSSMWKIAFTYLVRCESNLLLVKCLNSIYKYCNFKSH